MSRVYTFALLLVAHPAAALGASLASVGDNPAIEPRRFSFCYGYSCANVIEVGLSPEEWREVGSLFVPAAENGEAERLRIARAVAMIERLVGSKTGTENDVGGTFRGAGRLGQLDCVDESRNTATYLDLMAEAGFLKWHTRVESRTRGFFIFGWPHTTAVIRNNATGEQFAVDSWFHGNGESPEVVPIHLWKSGWRPPNWSDFAGRAAR